jgi:hypothetical protein
MAAQPIECARVNERLEHALVADAQINALAQIENTREGLLGSRLEHRIDRRAPDVPDGPEPKTNASIANDRELVA